MELNLKLCIASDLAGYDLKMETLRRLKAKGYSVDDMGCDSSQSGHYHIYAEKVACAVVSGRYDRGILICGTGQGMAIAANKVRGARAALCFTNFASIMSREHNNSNIFATGAWLVTADELEQILEVWLFGKYAGGKHDVRLNGISDIERRQVIGPALYRNEKVLNMTRKDLQNGNIPVDIFADSEAVFLHMARVTADTVKANNAENRPTVLIVPLGPVGQYKYLAELINQEKISLKQTTVINMDEYMWDETTLVDVSHPISFKKAMEQEFYDCVSPDLLMPLSQRIFPDLENGDLIRSIIDENGGVDLCIGGIGINGHVAFNEPQMDMSAEEFLAQSVRVVSISPESRIVNSLNEYGGAYEFIPGWGVTVGFKEIADSKRILLGCFRTWHRMVVRKAVLYPPSVEFPVTLLAGKDIRICIPEELI